MSGPAVQDIELRDRISECGWYHTMKLAPNIVTPGWFDTRGIVDDVGFPADLSGRRCLDVGTFDGFWAFEMERRGADEVVAVDLLDPAAHDWPANTSTETIKGLLPENGRKGAGFDIAQQALGSRVQRVERSVYELSEGVDGSFDFAYVGSLLMHLRDPVRALERVRDVCRGAVIVVDAIDLALTLLHPRRPVATLDARGRPWWWKANLAGLARMVDAAGLTVIGEPRRIYIPRGKAQPRPSLRPASVMRTVRAMLRSDVRRQAVLAAVRGDPQGVIHARPAPQRDVPRPLRKAAPA
jgi:tRNA (mo5U34)-methyltransferase